MVSIRKSEVLLVAVLFAVCVIVCSGAPSNSTASNSKPGKPLPSRIQRAANNKTSSATTTTKVPHGRSALGSGANHGNSSAPSPPKSLSRQTRNAPTGNSSTGVQHNNFFGTDADDTLFTQQQHDHSAGASTRNLTSLSHPAEGRSSNSNGTSASSSTSGTKTVPLRRVPARPQPSTKIDSSEENDDAGTFVVSSHVPVRPLPQSRNSTSAGTAGFVASSGNKPSTQFIQHEDADHF